MTGWRLPLISGILGALTSALALLAFFLGPWSDSWEARDAATQSCRRFEELYPPGASDLVDQHVTPEERMAMAARVLKLAEARAYAEIAADKDPVGFTDLRVQMNAVGGFDTADLDQHTLRQHAVARDALRKSCARVFGRPEPSISPRPVITEDPPTITEPSQVPGSPVE